MAVLNDVRDTAATRIECRGLRSAAACLPTFTLRAGEALCLHVPADAPPWHQGLLSLLTGKDRSPAVSISGSVRYLERPMPGHRWLIWPWNPSARDWLTRTCRLSPEEADSILARLAISPSMPIGYLSVNPRTWLTLEAWLYRPADVLVFETAGSDLRTAAQICNRVATRPPGVAAIYLKTMPDTACLPAARCLEVPTSPAPTSVAE